MAFLIRSLTALPEAGSTPEENASHRPEVHRKKQPKPSLCHTTSSSCAFTSVSSFSCCSWGHLDPKLPRPARVRHKTLQKEAQDPTTEVLGRYRSHSTVRSELSNS